MRPFWFLFFAVIIVGAVGVILAESVEAQAVSCGNQGTCRGTAFARTDGVSGHIRFCLTVAEFTCPGTPAQISQQAGWEMDAGDCVDLFYIRVQTGAVPPALPSNVVLRVLYDTTGTQVIQYNNGAEPANGQDYEFCATDDGTSTGDPRAGTYELFLQASVGGITPYTVNSQGTGGDEVSSAHGALRGNLQILSAVTDSPPAGSIFAYGPSGDEDVTVTFEHTLRAGDNNVETMQVLVTTDAAVVISGTIMEPVAGVMEEAFTVDDSFLESEQEYNIALDIRGTSALTGLEWTAFAASGHGSGIIVTGMLGGIADAFTADPRVQRDGFACVADLLNRGESLDCDISVLNARLEAITKAVRFNVYDNDNVLRSTQDLTGDPKGLVYAVGASDGAEATPGGGQWTYTITPVDTYNLGTADLVSVSSLYLCDAHPQTMESLSKDDFPTQDANENHTYFLGSDNIYIWAHIEGIRNDGTEIDTSGNAVSLVLIRPSGSEFAQLVTDTGTDGWTPAWNESPSPPAGAWNLTVTASFSGNSCMDTEMLEYVSSFTENLVLRLLFNTSAMPGDVVQIFVRTEVDDEAAIPDGVPVLKVSWVNTSVSPYAWENVLELSPMLSVVTWTPEVNGSLYVYNWTVPHEGAFNVWTRAPLQAAPIRESSNLLTVEASLMDISIVELDFWIPLLFWLGLIIFSLYQEWLWTAAFAIPGLLDTLFPTQIPFGFQEYFLFAVVGIVLEYFAGRRLEKRERLEL